MIRKYCINLQIIELWSEKMNEIHCILSYKDTKLLKAVIFTPFTAHFYFDLWWKIDVIHKKAVRWKQWRLLCRQVSTYCCNVSQRVGAHTVKRGSASLTCINKTALHSAMGETPL